MCCLHGCYFTWLDLEVPCRKSCEFRVALEPSLCIAERPGHVFQEWKERDKKAKGSSGRGTGKFGVCVLL